MEYKVKRFNELTTDELYEILRSRAEVFVKGQGIVCVDPDGVDKRAYHIFKTEGGRVSVYLRAYAVDETTVKIGRVLALRRNAGEGTALMRYAMEVLPGLTGCRRFCLDSQIQVVPFYEKLGFTVTSEEYLEEGVRHVDMSKEAE